MLRDHAKVHYLAHHNCAESLLMAANEVYGLGLKDEHILLMKGFGGGFGVGLACGAMTGALAALGMIYPTTKNAVEGGIRQDAARFVLEFETALGDLNCSVLKPKYFAEDNRCLETVLLGADVLEKHIEVLNS